MLDIFQKIYSELWGGTDTSLLIWIFFGFIVIIFISRKISKLKELANRTRLLFMIDIVKRIEKKIASNIFFKNLHISFMAKL